MLKMIEHPSQAVEISPAQNAALRYAHEQACARETVSRRRLRRVLCDADCSSQLFEEALSVTRNWARIVLHFHPDRHTHSSRTVAESLLQDGAYRNQFETGLSSGCRSAYPGGSRDSWERTLFGGAYHKPGATLQERPKYGALELIRYPDGPVPRFGSCYFVLFARLSTRTTVTFGGSEKPEVIERLGTLDCLHPVFASLLEEIAAGARTPVPWPPFAAPTLGVPDLTVRELLERIVRELPINRPNPNDGQPGRVLDSCIEAQIHGPVDLRHHVECLVMDPSFVGTPTGQILLKVGEKYEFPVYSHCGFQLKVEDVPDDFRGPRMRPLAQRISHAGVLTAASIGSADRSLHKHPETWRDWGTYEEALQHLKQLWHVLVHYGSPFDSGRSKAGQP